MFQNILFVYVYLTLVIQFLMYPHCFITGISSTLVVLWLVYNLYYNELTLDFYIKFKKKYFY